MFSNHQSCESIVDRLNLIKQLQKKFELAEAEGEDFSENSELYDTVERLGMRFLLRSR